MPRLEPDDLSDLIVSALDGAKARNIICLDVRKMTDITDLMIIASGTSSRHISALAQNVMDATLGQNTRATSIEGESQCEWVLIDYVDVIVHLMQSETRDYYDLENLWEDRLLPLSQVIA